MEIGTEISQTIKTSIKNKLLELGSYIDDELPEYILVMVANKRTKAQMTDDLGLFLGSNTEKFTLWLHSMLQKLKDATSIEVEDKSILMQGSTLQFPTNSPIVVQNRTVAQIDVKTPHIPPTRSCSPVKAPEQNKTTIKRSADDQTDENVKVQKTSKPEDKLRQRIAEGQKKRSVSSSVVKVPSSDRKRPHLGDDGDDDDASKKIHSLASVVKVKERISSVPVSMQASGSLIRRAMAEAQQSCTKLASSMSYDPSAPPIVYSQDTETKQRQKELLLQQHRQLQKMHQKQRSMEDEEDNDSQEKDKEGDKDDGEEEPESEDEQDDSDFSHVEEDSTKTDENVQEPEIELHVSDGETLDLEPAVSDKDYPVADSASEPKLVEDKRVIAFADSQAGSDEEEIKEFKDKKDKTSEGEHSTRHKQDSHRSFSSSRHKKHRAVKPRKKSCPKFIVTLEGVSSDYEDKYEEEQDQIPVIEQKKLLLQHRLGLFPRMNVPFDPLRFPHAPHFTNPIKHPIQHPIPPQILPPQNYMPLPQPIPQQLLHIPQQQFSPPPQNILPPSQPLPPHLHYNIPQQPPPGHHFIPSAEGTYEALPEASVIPVSDMNHHNLPTQELGQMIVFPQLGSEVDDQTVIEEKPYERCVFWPNCAKGDACPFHHPVTTCRTFPKCKFGEKCFFIHPQCKFDERCSNINCPFQHSPKVQASNTPIAPSNLPTKGLVNAPLSTVACKYHPTCTRTSCPFMHPSSNVQSTAKPCRFGNACTRRDCKFSHITATVPSGSSAFKWTASQHISERSFAAPDTEVTPLIVK